MKEGSETFISEDTLIMVVILEYINSYKNAIQ
jgi:hypothetical protein